MENKMYTIGDGNKLVVLLTMKGESELVGSVCSLVTSALGNNIITLAVYEADDWNADFSPWEYRMSPERIFTGEGMNTLENIKACIFDLNGKYDKIFIAGYSLAGLFSLWAVHETDYFDGCACCSGSLWFEGWEEYSESHCLKKPGNIYLSLGGKEEKAKDHVVAAIGDITRREDKRLSKDTNVIKHTLVMNPGGHFASPDKRLAGGIVWLIKEVQ